MAGETHDTGALAPDDVIGTSGLLALFLGGSPDGFTGLLLTLAAKADRGNLIALRGAFPRQIAVWQIWQATSPAPTAGELAEIIAALSAFGIRPDDIGGGPADGQLRAAGSYPAA